MVDDGGKDMTGIWLGKSQHQYDPWVIYFQPPEKSYCPVFFMRTSADVDECNRVMTPVELRFKGSQRRRG